jgi:hypothetical protein
MRAHWRAAFVVFTVLLSGGMAWAQWMPVSGAQTSTLDTISADGKIVNHQESRERYFRRSSGSVLIQQMADDGSNLPKRATLLDNGGTGKSYSINYETGVAVDRHRPARPYTSSDLLPASAASGMRQETVNGVPCVVVPSYRQNPDGTKTLLGQAWLAPQYNYLMIREDSVHPSPGGGSVHVHKELRNITGGVEPDAALFKADTASVKRARYMTPAGNQPPTKSGKQ